MDTTREYYLTWLRDAHAMEEQAITMMEGMAARLEHYPALKAKILQHVEETKGQLAALQSLLDRADTNSSMVKDTMGKIAAKGQAFGGMFTTDEVIKGAMASYTFEHMEIAAYEVLIATAQKLGDVEAVTVFEQILQQEYDMAAWLSDHTPETTDIYLSRSEADLEAKR
ncbi:ferritin-like domain-containing protein [Ketogulonicigenium vulgare]|uniref:ferritin-like domain-containing protein n=1 Tax=Ketogulonicigenium vulgare TaxID=92945 RepID=UPI002359AE31|nr:ferritin-like domain-containing protein [Ketogulonicigenium vulgare]